MGCGCKKPNLGASLDIGDTSGASESGVDSSSNPNSNSVEQPYCSIFVNKNEDDM